MTWLEVLVEGASDAPAVAEVLTRRFGLREGVEFRIHKHQGRGKLPPNPLARPDPNQRQLLHQLPAKLRGFAKSLPDTAIVLVVVDVDDTPCTELLSELNTMLTQLPQRPRRVLFRLAIEETESWFIADPAAVKSAFPKAKTKSLLNIQPDAVVGAWERLAEALGSDAFAAPPTKAQWAQQISPHLNLQEPRSPSLQKLISGIERELAGQ